MRQSRDLKNSVRGVRNSGRDILLAGIEVVSIFHVDRDIGRVDDFGMIGGRYINIRADP